MGCTKNTIRVMAFFACLFHSNVCFNFNLFIAIMVKVPYVRYYDWDSASCKSLQKKAVYQRGPLYPWSDMQQCYLLSGYGIGYFLSQLGSVYLVDMVGARWTVFVATVLAGVTDLLVPIAADAHWGVLLIVRVVAGLTGGVVIDAIFVLFLMWVPDNDRFNFSNITKVGALVGVALTWIICGLLIMAVNWPTSLYILGSAALLWSIFWAIFVRDAPPDIDTEPLPQDKQKSLEFEEDDGLSFVLMITSLPYISLVLLHYADLWGSAMFLTLTPMFIYEFKDIHLLTTAAICALAMFLRLLSSIIFEVTVNAIISRDFLDVTSVRKIFVFFSHIFTGIAVLAIGYVGCILEWTFPMLCVAACLSGASSVTSQANSKDLSPNFSRILYVFMHFIALTAYFVLPLCAGPLLNNKEVMLGWKNVFAMVAGVYVITGLVFLILGSGEVQSWNFPHLYAMEHDSRSIKSGRSLKWLMKSNLKKKTEKSLTPGARNRT